MKNSKQSLINDVLTGLAVAATFAAVLPVDALAALDSAVDASESSIVQPALHVAGLLSYGLGTVLTIAGIQGAKKHADNANSNPLAPAIGKLGAGAAFLAAPSLVATIQETGTDTVSGSASFSTIGF